ncbi:hypothetical protein Tco_1019069 [Tanacetum coccineum]|uniref:Uncharacterized protein n=1 Tax=Tanacetum coccineum TaxID=301880 RepID=A0ABQ5FWL4_9ASTR
MRKVSKWFRGLLGMKKDKENMNNSNAKTKRRWSFGKSMRDPSQRVTVENDSTRMRSCMSASEKEQNNHAIAIAETAVAAADAAAVVRLTSDTAGVLYLVAGKNGLPPRFNQSIEVIWDVRVRDRIDTRSEIHSKRLLTSYDSIKISYDERPKIAGMYPYRPYGQSRRNHYQDPERGFTGKDYMCSKTTRSTPRVAYSNSYEILLQEEFEIGEVKQYSNTCRGVAKQAFHRKCLPLVAPKCSKTLVAKCGPIQRLSNISIGCDSMEMLNVASIGRDRM